MPFDFYKVLHVMGLMMLFSSLGAAIIFYASGSVVKTYKLLISVFHGLGLVLLLVSGFGMLARMGGGMIMPAWVHPKLLVWVLMGGALFAIKKKANWSTVWWLSILSLGLVAASFAVNKPI